LTFSKFWVGTVRISASAGRIEFEGVLHFRFAAACLLSLFALAFGLRGATGSGRSPRAAGGVYDPQIIRDFNRGRELRRAGRLAEAAAAFERVLARAPNLAVAHLDLGVVRHDQHDYAASTAEFARAASLDPSLHQARLYLGMDAYWWGHDDLARKALEEAARWPPQAFEADYLLSLVEIRQGDLRAAARSLDAAARLHPKAETALYRSELANVERWRPTLDRMAAAERFVQADRLDDAKRECARILLQNPNLAGVHTVLGDIALQEKQFSVALREYRAELRLEPQSAPIRFKIADVLAESGDFSKARQAALSSLALQPDFGAPYCVLGRIAANQGNDKEAIADFEKALKLGVSDQLAKTAHYQLFRLLTAAGETTEANLHKEAYLRLQKAREQRDLAVARAERKAGRSTRPH
jgi:tetratricopeptide (TPR) repeat protein